VIGVGLLPSLTFTASAIAYASALGLLSMGLTLTYLTTKVPNFAHATIAMIGSVAMLLLIDRYYYENIGWGMFVTGPLVGGLLAAAFAAFTYVAILKPLADRGNTIIGLMIATFAVDIILMNILTLILNLVKGVHVPKLIGASIVSLEPALRVGGKTIQGHIIALPVAAVVLTILFHVFLTKTKFGVAMRAAIENPSLASIMGVNVNLVNIVSWTISGFLAGAAGALMAYTFKGVDPAVSALIIVSVFAGSIVGGISNIYWGLLGGFIVGFTEKWGTAILNNFYNAYLAGHAGLPKASFVNYEKIMSLGLVIIVLLYAPQGLAGIDWRGLAYRLRVKRGVEE
jgi:branched-chain amino acid transport system permease protein